MNSAIFEGDLHVNGKPITTGEICLKVKSGYISLTRAKEQGVFHSAGSISIDLFDLHAILSKVESNRNQEYIIKCKGNNLGSYGRGPTGHPGDGEFDNFKIILLNMEIRLKKGIIKFQLKGKTGKGDAISYSSKSHKVEILKPIVFKATFTSSLQKLKHKIRLTKMGIIALRAGRQLRSRPCHKR